MPIVILLLVGIMAFVIAENWATEYGTSIYKGWNLIYGFQNPEQIQGLESSNIKAVYFLLPKSKDYVRVYPLSSGKIDEIGELGEDQVRNSAFWVYSDAETGEEFNGVYNGIEYWLYEEPIPYTERQLYRGWNFVGITHDMLGKTLSEIKGDCIIEKSYGWDAGAQGWVNFPISEDFPRDVIGLGLAIKVSSNCKLGTSGADIPPVPNLP